MKIFLIFAYTIISTFALADVNYPVTNFRYISDWDYREEVEVKDKYVVMVFSSKDCLERTIIERTCWLFEKKLDYFVPKFSPQVKVVGFNTYFENYQVTSQFMVRKMPTVIIIRNGQQLSRFEPSYGTANWQDQLLMSVLETVSKIH